MSTWRNPRDEFMAKVRAEPERFHRCHGVLTDGTILGTEPLVTFAPMVFETIFADGSVRRTTQYPDGWEHEEILEAQR